MLRDRYSKALLISGRLLSAIEAPTGKMEAPRGEGLMGGEEEEEEAEEGVSLRFSSDSDELSGMSCGTVSWNARGWR